MSKRLGSGGGCGAISLRRLAGSSTATRSMMVARRASLSGRSKAPPASWMVKLSSSLPLVRVKMRASTMSAPARAKAPARSEKMPRRSAV
jgi:hypothetical protein